MATLQNKPGSGRFTNSAGRILHRIFDLLCTGIASLTPKATDSHEAELGVWLIAKDWHRSGPEVFDIIEAHDVKNRTIGQVTYDAVKQEPVLKRPTGNPRYDREAYYIIKQHLKGELVANHIFWGP